MRFGGVMLLLLATASVAEVDLTKVYEKARENVEQSAAVREVIRLEFIRLARVGMLRTHPGDQLPENLDSAVVAEAIPNFLLTRNDLIGYKPGLSGPDWMRYDEIVYMIRINGEPVSTANVRRVDGEWQVTSYGTRRLAEQIAAALEKVPQLPPSRFPLLVRIHSFDSIFLAYGIDNKLMFTSVKTNRFFQKAVVSQPAAEILKKLSVAAAEGRY